MPLSSDRHIIDEQFSKKLRHFKAQPSGRVWNRLSGNLHLQRRGNTTTQRMLLLAMLILFGFGSFWITESLQPGKNTSGKKPSNESAVTLSEKSDASSPASVITAETKRTDFTPATAGHYKAYLPEDDLRYLNETDNTTGTTEEWQAADIYADNADSRVLFGWQPENAEIKPLKLDPAQVTSPASAIESRAFTDHRSYPSGVRNPDFYIADAAGFYLGFGQTFNSTFIVDAKAYHDENLRFAPTFGIALMLQSGYNFNNKWGIEGAWIIHSQEGQRYKYLPTNNRTTSLEYIQKHISFNYMQFPLLVRYKLQGWSGITESPFFVNYSLGVQYGRLLSYSVDESKERVSNQNLFRKNEYALVAALDYDFISRKSSFVTVGIRTSLGSNLFVKDTPENLEFDDPHNFLLGVHAAVNFSLKKSPRHTAAVR